MRQEVKLLVTIYASADDHHERIFEAVESALTGKPWDLNIETEDGKPVSVTHIECKEVKA